MKKVAVLIYDQFCNFEFSVALEMLAMAGKSITVFAKSLERVKSEEGLFVVAEKTIDELKIEEFDALLLTGSADIREAIEDDVLLLRTGMLKGKRFMAGVNKEDLIEEGFLIDDIKYMVGWDDNLRNPVEDGFIREGNIITSVSYNFIFWAIGFGKAIGIEVYPKSFGVNM